MLDKVLLALAVAGLCACNQGSSGDPGAKVNEPRVSPPAKPEPAVEPEPPAEPPVDPAVPHSPPTRHIELLPAAICIETYAFDSDRSVLAEQRKRGGAKRWDDFATRYAAVYLEPETFHVVELVERFEIGATPLLWFTPDYAEAVVNAAVLSDLQVVDLTSTREGETVEIGTLTELGQGKIGGRELVEFLLHAGVLQTFAHIGAAVCLVSETPGDDHSYQAELSAEHVYFTNEEHRDAFGFRFELDPDGTMRVTGVEARPFSE